MKKTLSLLCCLIAISGNYFSQVNAQVTIRSTTAVSNSPVKTLVGINGNISIGGGGAPYSTSGAVNTFVGYGAGQVNTTGQHNTFLSMAGYRNTTGYENTFAGYNAGSQNVAGNYNTSLGAGAGAYNNNDGNVFLGAYTSHYTNGSGNIHIGMHSAYQYHGDNNVVIGRDANGGYPGTYLTGNNNTLLGGNSYMLVSGLTNATALGYDAKINASDKLRLGNTTVSVIEGQVAYSFPSDGRFKDEVKENVPGLDFITRLRPVTYLFNTRKFDEHITQNLDAETRKTYLERQDYALANAKMHTGFIAQEVEQAAKDLNYDFDGVNAPQNDVDNYSVAYSQFVVPLVKAVQEQQSMIESQAAQIKALTERLNSIENANSSKNTSINPTMDKMVLCQPNPTNGEIVVAYTIPENTQTATFVVNDMSGKTVFQQAITTKGNASFTTNLAHLPNGIYFYRLVIDNNSTTAQKLVIARQ
jgi:hypothetical protein